jgi:trimeric autotransporter adhesin
MNAISKSMMTLAMLSGAAYGAQPPDVVKSDSKGNTAMGADALFSLSSGTDNTASGDIALYFNSTGYNNTASGNSALYYNTSGRDNTASGTAALENNETGYENTAIGSSALFSNTSGADNTAAGMDALFSNTTGAGNAALGAAALKNNTSGGSNTASGVQAMLSNTAGYNNTATGYIALANNSTGIQNTALGVGALASNTSSDNNTASGYEALFNNTTGSNNIAMGYEAGYNLTTGSHNIEIGHKGAKTDNNIIRIGVEGQQAKTFVAGIYNTSVTGSAVMVNSSGQLGVVVSSERFKTDIAPMESNTAKLEQLRPVTFKLKTDAKGTRQYGLIAEEVAKVYPELVIRDEKGRIDGVRYDELAPMLLNEMKQQAAEIRDLKKMLVEMQANLLKVQSKDQLVALR